MADRAVRATYVLELEMDLEDEPGIGVWRVGMRACGHDRWHELVAAHTVPEDAPLGVVEAARDAWRSDVVANTVVWEEWDDEGDRTYPTPGEVAGWVENLTSDVWGEVAEQAFRVSGPAGWEWATERIRRSQLLALEMAVAAEYRLPYSELMRWQEDDRALAIAHLIEQRSTCPGCGVPPRARLDVDAAVVTVDNCLWCGMLAQARREATEEQHPRIEMKRGH